LEIAVPLGVSEGGVPLDEVKVKIGVALIPLENNSDRGALDEAVTHAPGALDFKDKSAGSIGVLGHQHESTHPALKGGVKDEGVVPEIIPRGALPDDGVVRVRGPGSPGGVAEEIVVVAAFGVFGEAGNQARDLHGGRTPGELDSPVFLFQLAQVGGGEVKLRATGALVTGGGVEKVISFAPGVLAEGKEELGCRSCLKFTSAQG